MNITNYAGKNPAAGAMFPSAQAPAITRWGNARIWLNLVFLFITLGTAIYSIEQARWIYPQPYLTMVLFLSMAATWLMMVFRLPWWILHPSAIAAGALILLWQGTMIIPGGAGPGDLIAIINSWWADRSGLQAGNSRIIFGLFMAAMTWFTGYLSTRLVMRYHNAWPAVLAGLVIILINLTNLPAIHFIFFIIFLLAALALIVQTNAVRQQATSQNKANYSSKSLVRLTIPLAGIIILSILVSWIVPQLNFPGLQDTVASKLPWKSSVEKSSLNVFNAIPPKIIVNTTGGLGDVAFGTSWNGGDQIVYTVISPQPAYWQVNVYEEYTSEKWVSLLNKEKLLNKNTVWDSTGEAAGKTSIKYQVIPSINTDIVLVAGRFVSVGIPVTVHYGNENEVMGVKSVRILNSNEKYTVTAYLADYSAESLAAAGENYPQSVRNVYFQLPYALPDRVRELSDNLTDAAKTPYEKILTISAYLSQFPYTLSVNPVSINDDPVDNFLFIQKKGFCLHFASALTVMLRSAGVPARLATGYVPGDPGPEKNTYILRDKHFHAWTQVYFPGYGWLDFDPTPGGPSSAQATSSAPLVSPTNLQDWDYWNLPLDPALTNQGNSGAGLQPNQGPRSVQFPFAKALGVIILMLLGAFAVFLAGYGTLRFIKPFYNRRIWNIDRDNPASSAYGNLYRLASMNGIVLAPWLTPQEVSSQIAETIPEQAENLQFLVRAYQDNRFGPDKGKPGLYEEAEILKARIVINNAIIEKKGRLQKFLLQS